MLINAPQNLQELQQRCQQITGKTIGCIAGELNQPVPSDLLRAKGWIGQLIEAYLGASSRSLAQPDFPHLGIELKTVPVDKNFKPLETTYVCTVQTNEKTLNWRDSWVYRKLQRVLWIPLLATPDLAIAKRQIMQPILWQMDQESEQVLHTDWEEIMEMLQIGHGKNLSAKYGTFLHIRPKAANSKVLIDYIANDGNTTKIVPKGFYLRTGFTHKILQQNLRCPNII